MVNHCQHTKTLRIKKKLKSFSDKWTTIGFSIRNLFHRLRSLNSAERTQYNCVWYRTFIFLFFLLSGPPLYSGFTVTLKHTTLGMTALDGWSARCTRPLPDNTQYSHRYPSMPPTRFETAIPARELSHIDAFHHAATCIFTRRLYLPLSDRKWQYRRSIQINAARPSWTACLLNMGSVFSRNFGN